MMIQRLVAREPYYRIQGGPWPSHHLRPSSYITMDLHREIDADLRSPIWRAKDCVGRSHFSQCITHIDIYVSRITRQHQNIQMTFGSTSRASRGLHLWGEVIAQQARVKSESTLTQQTVNKVTVILVCSIQHMYTQSNTYEVNYTQVTSDNISYVDQAVFFWIVMFVYQIYSGFD